MDFLSPFKDLLTIKISSITKTFSYFAQKE